PTRAAPHGRSDGAPAPVLRRHGPRVLRAGGGRWRHPARRRRIEAETAPPPPRTAVSGHAPSVRFGTLASLLLRLRHAGSGLTEEHLAGLVVEGRGAPELLADRPALPHGRPPRDGVPPAGDVREVSEHPLALVLGEDPRPGRDVGDRVLARQVGSVREAAFEH